MQAITLTYFGKISLSNKYKISPALRWYMIFIQQRVVCFHVCQISPQSESHYIRYTRGTNLNILTKKYQSVFYLYIYNIIYVVILSLLFYKCIIFIKHKICAQKTSQIRMFYRLRMW